MKILIIILFLLANLSVAQQSSVFNTYKEQYPDSHSVRLNQELEISITLKNGKINITQEIIEEDLYLDDAATFGSKKSLNYSSFFEIKNIEASSFSFENGKFRESEVKLFKEKDELDQYFYDDTKSINFIYPNLRKGSKSRLKYIEIVKNPRFLNSFYFGDFYPIIRNKITIIADKNINLVFKEYNLSGLDVQFEKQEKRNTNIFTWQLNNSEEYKFENKVPSYKNILPHIIPIIASYNSNGEKVSLLNDTSDLYAWYYSLVKNVNTDKSDENLVDLVKNLTADKKNDLEKVKSIYYWAQKNIKYVAFEYALGGFIPREADDVFRKKYGDCKDNSSILKEMLKIAGLKGHLTWIGTRDIPYEYSKIPTPAVDNHMILTYDYNGKTYFLDATGRYIPLNFPTSFIQGKEALIEQGTDNFIIKKVPVVPAENNAIIDTTIINFNGEQIIGKSKVEISGYQKIDFFNALENENTQAKIKEFYNQKLQKGNNKFLILKFLESNKFSYDKNFIVDYDFTINDYAKSFEDELYINLNINKSISKYRSEDNRKYEIENDYKSFYNYTTILNIPEDYMIDYLPENTTFSNDYLESNIEYQSDTSKIICTHSIKIDFLNLSVSQQKVVNELIKQIENSYKEIVILKKK
jgi:hypothetical protein